MNKYEFLQDKRFLQQLDKLRIKEQFVKITVLNWKEEPLKQIQGIVISGNVNLDGSSSMRRTATLSLFAEEKDNNLANVDNLFSLNKKCTLELGIVNNVPKYNRITKDEYNNISNNIINYQELYGNIIWFPLGMYIMFNPAIAHSMQGVTISMQLKDKMCLLNGDLGGEIHSAVQFSNQDEIVDMNTSLSVEKRPTLIYNIIKQLVNHWGNQKLENIIISEVPLQIKQVVKWMGSSDIWLVKQGNNSYYTLTMTDPGSSTTIKYHFQPGQDIGFIYTDFVYPGQLTCNAGETITSVLDKLIGIMGNYEYFYNVFGQFVFQEKANYLNMTNVAYWSKEENAKVGNLPKDAYEIQTRLTKPVYSFEHNKFTTAYNNTLNYNNVKNDFVVWGYRNSINNNVKVPCRFHLAVDKKPDVERIKQTSQPHKIVLFKDQFQDIRALPYTDQTAAAAKVEWLGVEYDIIWSGKRYASDWREEIYYQMLESEKKGTDQNTELNNSYFQYYAQLKEEFPKIFDLRVWTEKLKDLQQEYKIKPSEQLNKRIEKFEKSIDKENNPKQASGFKTDLELHPDQINYYLDFINEDSELGQYSVSNIGRRAKIIDDNNEGINCVFEPTIPDVVYINAMLYPEGTGSLIDRLTKMGQDCTQINPEIYNLFTIGGQLNSCFEKIKDLLYQYTHVNNTISITTLPIYYLQPNTRITVEDQPAGIYGDYIIQSISLPLDINSTMNINAYKALQKI